MANIFDPKGDGNCGFRCVAKLIFDDEEKYAEVRSIMVSCLSDNEHLFVKMLGKDGHKKLLKNLQPRGPVVFKNNWLHKLDMGQLLSDSFERPICFFSSVSCDTYVPVNASPDPSKTPIHLLFVNNNHWVLLLPSSSFPIPPIVAVPKSYRKKVPLWNKHLSDGLSLYLKLK